MTAHTIMTIDCFGVNLGFRKMMLGQRDKHLKKVKFKIRYTHHIICKNTIIESKLIEDLHVKKT